MFWKFGNLEITWNLFRRARLGTKDSNPATKSLGLSTDRPKEPETPPAERALRIAPVSKEPPAAREQGPRAQCKNPEG